VLRPEATRRLSCGVVVVELRGFEPLTPCMPSRNPSRSAPTKPCIAGHSTEVVLVTRGVSRGLVRLELLPRCCPPQPSWSMCRSCCRVRVRVPTVRNRRLQRGGRLQGRDRLRPDKPGRLHRSRPQARTAGQAGIGRGVSAPPGEVFVSLDVTKHAELKRDSRGARPAHHPEWEQPSRRRILWKSSWSSSSPSSFLESPSGRCWPCATLRRPTSSPRGADPAGESSKEPDASESSIESPTPRPTEDQP
jgi:hypothetical protein